MGRNSVDPENQKETPAGECGHFDEVATKYDEVFASHITAHYLRKRVRLIGLLLGGGMGLDVGCGTGRLMAALKPYGRVMGVDLSKGMLHVARRQRNCVAGRAQSQQLPFAEASFDVVFSVALMHHLAKPELVRDTVREMVRVTRRGGRIVIWDHNPRNPYWPAIMRKAPQDSGEERLIPAGEFAETLRACGVSRIIMFQSGFMPPFMPRWLVGIASVFEILLEHTPLLSRLAAHNVIIARK